MDYSTNNIEYTDEFELLLKAEGEKAEAMSILHMKGHNYFNTLSVAINIPVIVLSSFIGFLSTLELFPEQNIFLGIMSILVGVLKTLDSFFDWTKRGEAHRLTGLNYAKISKFIQLQLCLEKDVRINASDLYDVIVNDLQNLKDQEPIITDSIIMQFKKQYGDTHATALPTICNGLTKITINKKALKGINLPVPSPAKLTTVSTTLEV